MHPSLSGYSVMLGKGVFLGGKSLGYGKLTLMFEPSLKMLLFRKMLDP